jgi:hypothetical protein
MLDFLVYSLLKQGQSLTLQPSTSSVDTTQ